MDFILWFLWLWYGGDVQKLNDRDFLTRSQAYSRLKQSGVFAVPALHMGRRTANPEGQHRIQLLLDRRSEWWYPAVKSILSNAEITPEQVKLVAKIVIREPEAAYLLFSEVDASRAFWASSSYHWCQTMPYVNTEKTYEGEIAYMIRAARAKIHEPKTKRDSNGNNRP